MCLGVLLIACSCASKDVIINLGERVRNTLQRVHEDVIVEVELEDNLGSVREKLLSLSRTCDSIAVFLLSLSDGRRNIVESIIRDVRSNVRKEVALVTITDYVQDLATLTSQLVVLNIRDLMYKLSDNPVVKTTGDIGVVFEIETNVDMSSILSKVHGSKDIIVDDIRVLTYIDTRNLRPGTRVYLEEDIERFSFNPDSIVVVAAHIEPLRRITTLVNQGIKPALIIATPPCLSREEVELKRGILRLDVPAVVTAGFRGGVHIAGTILNTILSVRC